MKSKEICRSTVECEREASKVSKVGKGIKKLNGKKIPRSNSVGNRKSASPPSRAMESLQDNSSKDLNNAEDCSEDDGSDEKWSRNNGMNGGDCDSESNEVTLMVSNHLEGESEKKEEKKVEDSVSNETKSEEKTDLTIEEFAKFVSENGTREKSLEKVEPEERDNEKVLKKENVEEIKLKGKDDSLKCIEEETNRRKRKESPDENFIDLADEPSPKKINLKLSFDGEDYAFGQDSDGENPEVVEDVDGNKENEEKLSKSVDGSAESTREVEEEDSGCEIQVVKCHTISDSEKESIWMEVDGKKSQMTTDQKKKDQESRKEEEGQQREEHQQQGGGEDELGKVTEEEEEGERGGEEKNKAMEESEVERIEDSVSETDVSENKEPEENRENGESEKVVRTKKKNDMVSKNTRRVSGSLDGRGSSAKKKRLEERDKEEEKKEKEEEVGIEKNGNDSSPCENSTEIPEAVTSASSESMESDILKRALEKKCHTSEEVTNNQKTISAELQEPNGSTQEKGTFLANLRGTLKNLTRSDLEELIVQKLCEVITERSNVGELRRKAQALEEDQEKWRTKVQALTKQMREMEMVMKKYVNEVQKQIKEGANQVVVPLRVTRSVGLQVSFYSSPNKGPKPPNSIGPSPGKISNVRNSKNVALSKLPPPQPHPQAPQISQINVIPQNILPKSKVSSCPKSLPIPQRIPFQNSKKPSNSRPDFLGGFPQTRQSNPPQAALNRPNQNSVARCNLKFVSTMPTPQLQEQPSHQLQHQQLIENGSKVIDLTDDDDRQSAVVVKSPGPVRLLSHTPPQSQGSQNNKFAYLLPTTSSSTPNSNGQNRQVVVAAPTMPPLLFKGGTAPQSQSQTLNQSNRLLLSKPLKHPAPLPQQPVSPYQKPNLKLLPPRPALKISKVQTGIVLSWNMSLGPEHAPISSYQLYAYQEGISPPATSLWKKVGDVKALPLPMACTLTQFMSGHKYHFAVRAVDLHSRIGPFSFPGTIVLVK